MTEPELVDVIELDKMTGNERVIPLDSKVTKEAAAQSIEWREKNITNRYSYYTVPTGTFEQ